MASCSNDSPVNTNAVLHTHLHPSLHRLLGVPSTEFLVSDDNCLIQENLTLLVQTIINTRGGGVEKCKVIGNSILPVYHGCVREGHRHVFKVAVTLQANTPTYMYSLLIFIYMSSTVRDSDACHNFDRGQTNTCHPVIVYRCVSHQLWCQRTPHVSFWSRPPCCLSKNCNAEETPEPK